MNPWIAGRIIETMQTEARKSGEQARLGRHARDHHPRVATNAVIEVREPRRARLGLAVARVGLRIAGRPAHLVTQAAAATPTLHPSYRSNPWTTCGATSTSSR